MSDADWTTTKLKLIMEATADFRGPKFFTSLVLLMTHHLGAQFAFVTILDEDGNDRGYTLAFADKQNLSQPYSYDLSGMPCRTLLGGMSVNVPCNVVELYPGVSGASGYVAHPLKDSSGKVIGGLGVEDPKPLKNTDEMLSLIRLLAGRTAAELECYLLKKKLTA
jgi:hypothetical protein